MEEDMQRGWCGCSGQGEMEADDSLVFSKVQ